VHRRHESDLDKIEDDLVSCQSEIQSLESRIPDLADRHRFYQDLRGYVTDLVECFNEKVSFETIFSKINLKKIFLNALAGFDLTAHMLPSRDDTTT
jgi:hypothetical protein